MSDSPSIQREQIYRTVREYLLAEILAGEDSELLTETTPLISGGILDSIGVTRLITHLEAVYPIQFTSEEINVDRLDTLSLIISAIEQKTMSRA